MLQRPPHALATTLGVNTDTGIAGLTLGGSYGWLAGQFGLACDNLIRAEVVTADGRSLTVTETDNADLLWGLRGAGANLVIATRLDHRLHELGPVFGGLVIYGIEHGCAALRFFNEFSAECSDEISTAGLLLHLPDGTPAVAIGLCYAGPLDKAAAATAPLLRSIPVLANHLEVQPFSLGEEEVARRRARAAAPDPDYSRDPRDQATPRACWRCWRGCTALRA